MPTDTFHRLPAEKKQRIFQAAVQEFARCRFSEASINQIIKQAAIPRGSFYQYFAGKEDLYLYVLQEISKEKLDVYNGFTSADPELSFLEVMEQAIPAIFVWADEHDDYNKIGLRMLQDDSSFMRETISKMSDSIGIMYDVIKEDQAKGRIRRDIEAESIVDLLQMVSTALLREYFDLKDQKVVMDKIKLYFDILFQGLRAKQEAGGH
ncbi:MAG: TetR/AcrR family transcriptional regulator [Clostridiales bacterium]